MQAEGRTRGVVRRGGLCPRMVCACGYARSKSPREAVDFLSTRPMKGGGDGVRKSQASSVSLTGGARPSGCRCCGVVRHRSRAAVR